MVYAAARHRTTVREAAQDYEAATQLFPLSRGLRNGLAYYYLFLRLDSADEHAIVALEWALRFDPLNWDLRQELVRLRALRVAPRG